LIGLKVVTVIQNPDDQMAFGLVAASAFALGSIVLLAVDRRPLWAVGAVGLALVILMYINVAPDRQPHYEVWGILIRVVQVLLLMALGYLAIRPRVAPEETALPELPRTAR
jgi:hypothetical protein